MNTTERINFEAPEQSRGWPKVVPIFEPRDMVAGMMRHGETGTRCMLGWLQAIGLNGLYSKPRDRAMKEIRKAAESILGENRLTGADESIVVINDKACRTNRERAAILNLAFRNLGYRIPRKACRP